MAGWIIFMLFAAVAVFCATWKCGEWLSRRKAAKFAERRESWRELEMKDHSEHP